MAAKAAVVEKVDNLPAAKFRVGSVTATVWKNDKGFSVTVQKSWKNDEDKWSNTDTLFHSDVLCAVRALQRAEDYIAKMQA